MANENGSNRFQDKFTFFKKTARAVGDGLSDAAKELRSDFNTAAKNAENIAGTVAINVERFRKDWNVDQRMKGAALGAKIGALAGIRGGPVGLQICIPIGIVAGAVYGPNVIEKFEKRYDEWKEKYRPSGNDADNERSPPTQVSRPAP